MRIISQNRTMSYDFDKINLKIVNDTNICTTEGDKTITLGAYETSERATEIFNDIHKVYLGLPLIQTKPDDEEIEKSIREWNDCMAVNVKITPCMVENIGNVIYTLPTE